MLPKPYLIAKEIFFNDKMVRSVIYLGNILPAVKLDRQISIIA